MKFKLIFFAWFAFAIPCLAEESPLEGISGVRVFSYPSEDTKVSGASAKEIQTEVELLLRQYGVRVLSQEEYRNTGAALSILARGFYEHTVSGKRQGYFSVVSLEIEEYAYIARTIKPDERPTPVLVRTWETSRAKSGPPESLKPSTMESVQQVVKEFANEFLKANQ